MKISLNWLTDYVDVSALPAQELADVLTRIGLVCDSINQTDSDVVFDLDVTSNRPDCLGHIGVAREISTALGLPLNLPDVTALPHAKFKAADLTSVEVLAPDLCPRYTARIIRNVRVGLSPSWLAERLEAVGLRTINNVVDVTNYVMLEYSQPLHAFDRDLLAEGRIVVRRAKAGEDIVSIDGTRCPLTEKMLVIADARKPVAIAGIMGGIESEIGVKTKDVLLEAAQFDPMTIRQTSRNLALLSDSSYRFERAVDPVGLEAASRRACQLILQTAGGELAEGVVDVWAKPYEAPRVRLRPERTTVILGMEVPAERQVALLDSLGLAPVVEAGQIVCTIPSHRGDLSREIDLIEEVCRLNGLDKIPTRDKVSNQVSGPSRVETLRHRLRDALMACGFDEAMTFTFTDDAEAALLGFPTGIHVDVRVRKTNNLLRPTLLCSLLRACKTNQDVGNVDVNLYEIAAVFPPKSGAAIGDLPDEYIGLGLISQRDVRTVRGAIEAMMARLAPSAKVDVLPVEAAGFAEGASAEVLVNGVRAGVLGAFSQAALDYYGLEKPHAGAMLRLDVLMQPAELSWGYRTMPKFPPVQRDLSLLVDEAVTWQALSEMVAALHQSELETVAYVGTYRGKQIAAGKKSVTMSLTYRSAAGTLRHEQVDECVSALVLQAKQRFGAELRA